jgi:hypothetical protein
MLPLTDSESIEFNVVTSFLSRSRRARLREELESDFNAAEDVKSQIRTVRSHTLRAILDLGRIQYLHPLAFTALLVVVFIGVARTSSFSLLGLFVFLAIFQTDRKEKGLSSIANELFHQLIFFICFSEILLSSVYGKELRILISSEIMVTLVALLGMLYLLKIFLSVARPNRTDLKSHIWAERLHSLMLFGFTIDILTRSLSANPLVLIAVGTLGWILILILSNKIARPNIKSERAI